MGLEDKLAAANQEGRRRAKRLLILSCVAGVGIAVAAAASILEFSWPQPSRSSPEKVERSPSKAEAAGAASRPRLARPFTDQNQALTGQPSSSTQSASTPTSPACSPNRSTDQACQKIRELFKEELKAFEAELEPKLEDGSVRAWAVDVYEKIFAHKSEALQAFGDTDYPNALTQIKAAAAEASQILEVGKSNFEKHLRAAISAFEASEYQRAKAEIDNALLMDSDHQLALEYQRRIELLPAVLDSLRQVQKARSENDFRSEVRYLEKLVKIDPARQDAQARLNFLRKKLAEEDFANFLSKGFQAVQAHDLGTAKASLRSARNIFSDHPEISLLTKQIERLDQEIAVNRSMTNANKAILGDDWVRAHQEFSNAKSIDPTNTKASEGEAIAASIIATNQGLDEFIERPARLSSPAVAAAAQRLLNTSQHLSALSPTLKSRAETLAKLVTQANKPVEVIVKSDGKTDVFVRTVGIIGKTIEKAVKLRPGEYTFEGTRVGYKSKLVILKVPIGGTRLQVTVICDEQI